MGRLSPLIRPSPNPIPRFVKCHICADAPSEYTHCVRGRGIAVHALPGKVDLEVTMTSSLGNAGVALRRSRLAVSFAVGPLMALVMLSMNAARAGTVTVLFQEVGSDVQTTISGSLGLSGLAYQYDTQNFDAYLWPSGGSFSDVGGRYFSLTYANFFDNNVSRWLANTITGPLTFGDNVTTYPSSITGDPFGFKLQVGGGGSSYAAVFLPVNYTANLSLSASNTWSNRSFATLGLSPGTYTWTMGSDSIVINIGVPEPSTYATALAGIACGGFSIWRRRKRA